MLMIMKVYDGSGQILGRLSTNVAKELLKGETVFIINAEKVVIAGKPEFIKKKYLVRRQRGDPIHGPFFPRTPASLVKRTIRGMLPMGILKGRKAFKRLKVYTGVPEELKNQKPLTFKDADSNKLNCKKISVEELCLWLGAKKRW